MHSDYLNCYLGNKNYIQVPNHFIQMSILAIALPKF